MRSGLWVVGAGVVWALFVLFLMRWLRRVLRLEIAQQLQTITSADPADVATRKKPTFSELNEVTQAIATARQSILVTTEEQHAKIESLEVELNRDDVTGLVNRKYFINELRRELETADASSGVLYLFRQRDLAEINKVMARANVDEWLQSLSQQLTELVALYQSQASLSLARINGSDFVLMMSGLAPEAEHKLLQAVQQVLRQQRIQLPTGEYCRWAIAQTDFKPGQFLAHILARLDQALMRAESAGHSGIERFSSAQTDTQTEQPRGGETQWRALIQDALTQQSFSLELSPKTVLNQTWLEAVLAMRSPQSEEKLLGYQFMPVATRLGLSAVCDLRAFELALTHLQQSEESRIILRVSLSSIVQECFSEQVAQQLRAVNPSVIERLAVELDAYALSSEPVRVAHFTAMLADHGVLRGARRVLQLPRVLLDLNALSLSYVRVTQAEWAELEQKEGGKVVLRSALEICQIAKVSFVFDGDLTQLSEINRQMLCEYGK